MSFKNKFPSPPCGTFAYLRDFCVSAGLLRPCGTSVMVKPPSDRRRRILFSKFILGLPLCLMSDVRRSWVVWGCAVGRGPGRSEIFLQSRLLCFALESFSQVPHYQFFADSIFASLFVGISFQDFHLLHIFFSQIPCLIFLE